MCGVVRGAGVAGCGVFVFPMIDKDCACDTGVHFVAARIGDGARKLKTTVPVHRRGFVHGPAHNSDTKLVPTPPDSVLPKAAPDSVAPNGPRVDDTSLFQQRGEFLKVFITRVDVWFVP